MITYAAVATTAQVISLLGNPPLSGRERSRATRLANPVARADFHAVRTLARWVVGTATESCWTEVAFGQICPDCQGDHGRPFVVEPLKAADAKVQVAWAHSRGVVAAIAGPERCGIDVERKRAVPSEALSERALTSTEQQVLQKHDDPAAAFRSAWTLKEAWVKTGLVDLPHMTTVSVLNQLGAEKLTVEKAETTWHANYDVQHHEWGTAAAVTLGAAKIAWITLPGDVSEAGR